MRRSEPPATGDSHRAPIAPERLETDRMVGERLRVDDAQALVALLLHPGVADNIFDPGDPRTAEAVRRGLEAKLGHWEHHGFGQWLFRDRTTGVVVGRGGPQHTMATGRDEVEIGWVIAPDRWGQGLGTELARASVDVALGPLALDEVIAYTQPDNVGSRRVMEKTGFRYDREIIAHSHTFVLYRRGAAHS